MVLGRSWLVKRLGQTYTHRYSGTLTTTPGSMPDNSRLAKTVFHQERMHNLHAVLVGAGALGNQVFQTLGLLGTGRITVVDPESLEDLVTQRPSTHQDSVEVVHS